MNTWVEQELKNRKPLDVSPARAKTLDDTKRESHPIIVQEAARGDKPFDPIRFQPVKSPGLFEAEFAKRGNDLIFHFWPHGLHEADRLGQPRPPFLTTFRHELQVAFGANFFAKNVEISDDRDMGAIFVKVSTFGAKQFWHQLSVKVVTDLHKQLGGE
jgi:hypothetical protein